MSKTEERKKSGIKFNHAGLAAFSAWDLEGAIKSFKKAVKNDPNNPDYHLNLVKAYARNGSYDEVMTSLGHYLRVETESDIAERYEMLFSTGLDPVESLLIESMQAMEFPMQQVGKAIQLWLEYRISYGRRPLRTPKPGIWAAALTYSIVKVNSIEIKKSELAKIYQVSVKSLTEKYNDLVTLLDIMPADYRYFTGETNPLDKLIEAAQLLDDLDKQFKD
ncbi:MAG: tetratricopeptide repeat protein [Chloroflexota bacterium]